jgi:hypothetical protein
MTDIGLFSLDEDSNVVFSFKNIERVVSGPEEALQVASYHLFTSPGSNTWNRDEGGGLQKLLGAPLKSDEEINADTAIIVNKANDSIRLSQSSDKPADATIIGLKLTNVAVKRGSLEIAVTIRIDLLDGNSFQATFRVT